ncbi:MAG: aspartyl protease family protein [Sedimentisphaerales bacterium]|nr:aspartyl protease family protein [Sedimentisphaerales bacterium]
MPDKTHAAITAVFMATATLILAWCGACASSGRLSDFAIADSGTSSYAVVPLTIESRLPVIPVTIGGVEVPLTLDTGGFEEIALSPTALQNLDVRYTGRRIWSVGVHGLLAPSFAREFVIPEMHIGNMRLTDVPGHEFHFSDLRLANEPPPALKNGIVGLALLGRFKLIIDYPAGVCVLSTDGRCPPQYRPETWPSCEIDLSDPNIGIQSTVAADGRELRCVWDTGASYSIIRPGIANSEMLTQRKSQPFARFSRLLLADHDCGPFEFAEFDFRQPPVDAIIGYNFFREHIVFLDVEKGILAFD